MNTPNSNTPPLPPLPHPPPLEPLVQAMTSLADETRLRLLRLLERQELGVGELASILQLPQPTVSRHLKTLSDAAFVTSRREATSNLYRLRTDELPPSHQSLWHVAREQFSRSIEATSDDQRLVEVLRARSSSRAFFAGAANEWDRLRGELYGDFTATALAALLPESSVVADLGCGTGTTAALLGGQVARVHAVDNSPEMLAAARARCAGMGNVQVHEAELHAVPLASGSCDAAVLMLALTYVPDPGAAIVEAGRLLRPGGRVVIVDLLSHGRDDFRRKMNQLHPGFAADQIGAWLTQAGLYSKGFKPLDLPTDAKGPRLFVSAASKRKNGMATEAVGSGDGRHE
jgi:ubiquinone/menaquinone biosynthesis C-methylase UbiE